MSDNDNGAYELGASESEDLLVRWANKMLPQEVVLTYDDGPWPTTPQVLSALAAHCMTSYKYTRKHWRRLAFHRRGVAEFSIKETLQSECASLAGIADFN